MERPPSISLTFLECSTARQNVIWGKSNFVYEYVPGFDLVCLYQRLMDLSDQFAHVSQGIYCTTAIIASATRLLAKHIFREICTPLLLYELLFRLWYCVYLVLIKLLSKFLLKSMCIYIFFRGLFYYHALTKIPAWISIHMASKVWDDITYSFQTSTVALLEFGNRYVISPHSLLRMWLFIHDGIKVKLRW